MVFQQTKLELVETFWLSYQSLDPSTQKLKEDFKLSNLDKIVLDWIKELIPYSLLKLEIQFSPNWWEDLKSQSMGIGGSDTNMC